MVIVLSGLSGAPYTLSHEVIFYLGKILHSNLMRYLRGSRFSQLSERLVRLF